MYTKGKGLGIEGEQGWVYKRKGLGIHRGKGLDIKGEKGWVYKGKRVGY